MGKATHAKRGRSERMPVQQQQQQQHVERPRWDQDFLLRPVGRGYIPVRSYQVPADRHE